MPIHSSYSGEFGLNNNLGGTPSGGDLPGPDPRRRQRPYTPVLTSLNRHRQVVGAGKRIADRNGLVAGRLAVRAADRSDCC